MENEVLLNKEKMELYISEFASALKKRVKGRGVFKMLVVGGSSIVLTESFRESTRDIDVANSQFSSLKLVIKQIADKYGLGADWINTSVLTSASYSSRLYAGYGVYYKTYSDIIEVYTLKPEALLVMKLIAFRKSTNDRNDISDLLNKYTDITAHKLSVVEDDLYGEKRISKDAWSYVNSIRDKDIKSMRSFD